MKIIGIIPSRYGSSRLEGKPLKDILGKPMIQWVYEATKKSKLLTDVIVATDDERILNAVLDFGGKAQMTSIHHRNGTERIAEVAASIDADIVVNIQGDEPMIDYRLIDDAIQPLIEDPALNMSTLAKEITSEEDFKLPQVVKVVYDKNFNALYFSRALIPYPRNSVGHKSYEHVGIYVYRKSFLMKFIEMPQTPLEKSESLEQLRALENGETIRIVPVRYPYNGLSVDTQEDLEKVRMLLAEKLKE